MKRLFNFVLVAAMLAFTVVGVEAQTATPSPSNVQAYVGVQFSRANFDYRAPASTQFAFNRSTDSFGGDVALTGFVSDHVGLTADLSATFTGGRSDTSLVTALGGITVASRTGRVQPFVRALAGVGREKLAADQANFQISSADTSFAALVGGGFDVRLGDSNRVKLRVLQLDLLHLNSFDSTPSTFFRSGSNRARVGVGLVF